MDRSINRIELRGNVGKDPSIYEVSGRKVMKFPLATNENFQDSNGNTNVETTWHNIAAWEGTEMPEWGAIRKGTCLSVIGRIRNSRYTNQNGEEKYYTEVSASRIAIDNVDNL